MPTTSRDGPTSAAEYRATLADFDGKDAVRRAHVAEALCYRRIHDER